MKIKKFSPYSKVRKSSLYCTAKEICELLQKAGFEAYFVGGCVRDLVMNPGKLPKDIDIATSALPNKIQVLFPGSRFVGEAFGVCLVKIKDYCIEVATFRVDGEYVDKRRPKFITKGNFLEDSCRRDFTINALYYDPIKKIIKDVHNGLRDIKSKIIRCVGNPAARFDEDALRVLRALRFAANLHFKISLDTHSALLIFSKNLHHISRERILLEFHKVHNFYGFFSHISCYVDLNVFFKYSNLFKKRQCVLKKVHFNSFEFTFLKFLLNFSLFYEFEVSSDFFHEIDEWPLTRQDNTLCKLYLQLFTFEKFVLQNQLDQEESRFLLFIHLLKINKISSISLNVIKQSAKYFLKRNELLDLLNRNFLFPNNYETIKIIEVMQQKEIPNYFTKIFIDYYSYNLFIGNKLPEIENFIVENLVFIEKMTMLISKLRKEI